MSDLHIVDTYTLEELNTLLQTSTSQLTAENFLAEMFVSISDTSTSAIDNLKEAISGLSGRSGIKSRKSKLHNALDKMTFSQYAKRQIQVPKDFKGDMPEWMTLVDTAATTHIGKALPALESFNKLVGNLLTNEDYSRISTKLVDKSFAKHTKSFRKHAMHFFPGTHRETQELGDVYQSKDAILQMEGLLSAEFVISPKIVDHVVVLSETIAARTTLLSGKVDGLKESNIDAVKRVGSATYEYAQAVEFISMLTFDRLRVEGHFKNLSKTIITDFD